MSGMMCVRPFTEEALSQNDDCVKFYKGLPKFKAVYEFVWPPLQVQG